MPSGHKLGENLRDYLLNVSKNLGCKGFTLLEIMVVIAIIGTLAAIAIPNYLRSINQARISRAMDEIRGFEVAAFVFYTDNGRYPNALIEAGVGNPLDPWGNPYVYYPMSNVPKGVIVRKDKSLHPINTDFDLYSMGADGKTVAPFTAKVSQDDIVRANNGAFVGLVEDY
jgi:general secretion pathway protein G